MQPRFSAVKMRPAIDGCGVACGLCDRWPVAALAPRVAVAPRLPERFRGWPDAVRMDRSGVARRSSAAGPIRPFQTVATLRCGGVSQIDEPGVAAPRGVLAAAWDASALRCECGLLHSGERHIL